VGTYTSVPAFCAPSTGHGGLWQPDQRRDEQLIDIDLMVKF
jgi:hypothetical protein